VDVIIHKRVMVDSDFTILTSGEKDLSQLVTIQIVPEHGLPVVPSFGDVLRNSRLIVAWLPRHTLDLNTPLSSKGSHSRH
jgi:hypothetical protein